MSGDWIKMRAELTEHPKVIALTRVLAANDAFRRWLSAAGFTIGAGADDTPSMPLRCVTTSLLMRAWSASRKHGRFVTDDLHLPYSKVSDIDQMAGAPGVGEAMRAVGWLEVRDAIGVYLPNFTEFNVPMSGAEKQKAYRDRKRSALPTRGNEKPQIVTPREEKKREEEASKSSCAEVAGATPTLSHVEHPIAVIEFTTNLGKPFAVTAEMIEDWKRDFPNVDVEDQLRRARAWSNADTKRRKTAGGMKRFLVGWLSRSHDSSRSGPHPIRQQRPSLAERAAEDEFFIRDRHGP